MRSSRNCGTGSIRGATSAAAALGRLDLTPGAAWLGTTPALVALSVAAVLEVGAYFVPALDHALDAVATLLAVLALLVPLVALATAAVFGYTALAVL